MWVKKLYSKYNAPFTLPSPPKKVCSVECMLQDVQKNVAVQLCFTKIFGNKKSSSCVFLHDEQELSQVKKANWTLWGLSVGSHKPYPEADGAVMGSMEKKSLILI